MTTCCPKGDLPQPPDAKSNNKHTEKKTSSRQKKNLESSEMKKIVETEASSISNETGPTPQKGTEILSSAVKINDSGGGLGGLLSGYGSSSDED